MAERRALQTLVRMDWGKNNPDFKSMFTNFFIPDNPTSSSTNGSMIYSGYPRVRRMPPAS